MSVIETFFQMDDQKCEEALQVTIIEHEDEPVCELVYGVGQQEQNMTLSYRDFQKEMESFVASKSKDLYALKNLKTFHVENKYESSYTFCNKKENQLDRVEIYLEGETMQFFQTMEVELDHFFKQVRSWSGQVKEYDFSIEFQSGLSPQQHEQIRRAKYNIVSMLQENDATGKLRTVKKVTMQDLGKNMSHQTTVPDEYYVFEFSNQPQNVPSEIRIRIHHNDPFARMLQQLKLSFQKKEKNISRRKNLEYMKRMYERAKSVELSRLDDTVEEVITTK